jgi:hypothetical protein
MLDLPDASDEELGKIKAAWDIVRKPQQSPFGGFGGTPTGDSPQQGQTPSKSLGGANEGTPDDKAAAAAEVRATQSVRKRRHADVEQVEKDPLAIMITKVSNAVVDRLVDMEP